MPQAAAERKPDDYIGIVELGDLDADQLRRLAANTDLVGLDGGPFVEVEHLDDVLGMLGEGLPS